MMQEKPMMTINIYKDLSFTCPRCHGSGKQKADNTRVGKVGRIGGTNLYNLKSGTCQFCGGVGRIYMG